MENASLAQKTLAEVTSMTIQDDKKRRVALGRGHKTPVANFSFLKKLSCELR